ncbi:MAG: folate family ECF transporter S component [Pseudoruminococcus massiliensis]|uniref:folate family ECF transporter S component n=1 Tax=Pseudoruminococcus massiliensis TaxID=2086583 RepID=UPI00399313F1
MFKNKLNETKSRKVNVKLSTQTMAVFAILIATQFVISQFLTFQVWNIKIGFSFVPVVIAARLYGAVGATEVAGIGDIIGVMFRPVGIWFPPITISAMLVGAIFGLLLKKSDSFIRILISVLISEFVFSLFITPLWLTILYKGNETDFFAFYFSTLVSRLFVQIIPMTIVKLVVITAMLKAMDKIKFVRHMTEVNT